MLATQVQYWNYLENQRHNMATEKQALNELEETRRSNLVRESVSQGTLNESVRHNKAGENISWANLREVERHNKEQENIGFANVHEAERHNREQETLYPYQRDNYQMQTTTGYVDSAVNAGDKLGSGMGPLVKGGIAMTALAGMLTGSDISHSNKSGDTDKYGHFSNRGTSKPQKRGSSSHYSDRPTLSDSDRNKYFRY